MSTNVPQLNIANNWAVSNKSTLNSVQFKTQKTDDAFSKAKNSNDNVNRSVISNPFNIYNPRQVLKAYLNPSTIDNLVNANPKVKEILNSNNVEYSIHPENVKNIINTHLSTTTAAALQIANEMQLSASDKQILEQACLFHDFGKVLIPKEILEKPGELTSKEKEIMHLHSDLGYELLSTTTINKRVLDLIKNHHNPQTQNDDVLVQILSVADIYSALREQRAYKKPLSNKDAFSILDQKAKEGTVSTEVVNALKSSVLSSYAA